MIMRKLIGSFLLLILAGALTTGCATPAETVDEPASVQKSNPAITTPLLNL